MILEENQKIFMISWNSVTIFELPGIKKGMHVLVLQKHHFIGGKVLRIKLAQSFQLVLFIVLFSVVAVKGHLAHRTFYPFFVWSCLDQTCYPEREARDAEYIQLYNELETTLHLQPNLFIEQNKYFSTVRFPVETFHQLAT